MFHPRVLLAMIAAMSLGAPATVIAADPAAKPAPRACFRTNDVENFNSPDERTVYLRINRKDVYRLDLFAPCPDVDWAWEIAVESRGSSWICSPLDATVVTKTPIGPQRCQVHAMTKLTPEQVAELPAKHRP